jgi:glucose-6-phosphate-specific signal transduction histidine kinase
VSGFRGIRERVRQLHGELRIESGDFGTRILVSISSPKEDDDSQFESDRVAEGKTNYA